MTKNLLYRMKCKRFNFKSIVYIIACILVLYLIIGFAYINIFIDYDLETSTISEFTDAQKTVVFDEFELKRTDDLILTDLLYTKNYTLWGLGNEIVTLCIKTESLAKFVESQSVNNIKQQNESQTELVYISKGEESIQ